MRDMAARAGAADNRRARHEIKTRIRRCGELHTAKRMEGNLELEIIKADMEGGEK
jgi:hypothetical protein